MIRNNLKIAWRNITKNKLYSSIKIGGFAFSISICILIVLYIKHQTSYNKFYPSMDRVYRLIVQAPEGNKINRWVSLSAPGASTLKEEIPAIETSGRMLPNPLFGAGSNQFSINQTPDNHYDEGFVYIDQSILDMFPSPMLYGQLEHALDKPNTLVLTKSKATKYFKGNPIGQQIYLNNNKSKAYTITGVIEDISSNSTLYGYDFFMSLAGEPFYPGEQIKWTSNNYTIYVKLKAGANVKLAEQEIIKNYITGHYIRELIKAGRKVNPIVHQIKITLQNALDIHLHSSDIEDDKISTLNRGDIRMVWTFAAIALFILLIACINFINLSTANATTRAKEIGIRKTIGSNRKSLISQFMCEALSYSFLSLFIGLFLASLLLPLFNNIINQSVEIPWLTWYFIPFLIFATFIIGIIAGLYPALYLSSFKPISALKNKSAGNPRSSFLRNGLVIFQFATSITLIIGALISNQQIQYILNKDLGFSKDQIIVLRGLSAIPNQLTLFKNELKNIPSVSNVSIGDYLPVPIDGAKRNGNPFWLDGRREMDLAIQGQLWNVDQDYISIFELQLVDGRNFNPQLASDSSGIIVNKQMLKELGITNPIGTKITNGQTWTILGVVDDFIFESLKGEGIAPLGLTLQNSPSLMVIKVKPQKMDQTLAAITKVWNQFAPNQKINYSFLDEGFEALYRDVERTKNIFICFAVVAICIASLGLFGLATYITEQRTKEIGVRKVLGASNIRLLKLLSGDFMKLVFAAIVIATPIAWWAMNQWLADFNYRIDIGWLYFAVAGCFAILIALGTISFQTLKAIRSNPVDSLRNE
ncbi:ABC transporter permease [Sphingobacterium sp. SRCM116780]|uniref:ABC transporter permease n=1 Tax=Sphingobacterium sp. SRCM116780 TaxID=2907623 RepID=UPI001F3F7218|nr:ABC transporter permease [Sphingobacterium sp. SRCM116780]UIR55124.1 ABC transporter permease [Sphingobacterium sp. SRCM116780]